MPTLQPPVAIIGYEQQQPLPPPTPELQQQQQKPSHAPVTAFIPEAGASSSLHGALHLLTARSVAQGDSDSMFGSVVISGMVLAGQLGVGGAESRRTGPPGIELWVSDSRGTNHVTTDPSNNVYGWVEIPPGEETVVIGSGKKMRLRGLRSINPNMHAATDVNVNLACVILTHGIGLNKFPAHNAQARQTTTLDKDGVHLLNKQLTFPRSEIGSYLYAARIDPTSNPKTAFTAVPVISGSGLSPPPQVTVSHPRSPRRVEGVVFSNVRFPPTASGEVSVASSTQFPTGPTSGYPSDVEQAVVVIRPLVVPGQQVYDTDIVGPNTAAVLAPR